MECYLTCLTCGFDFVKFCPDGEQLPNCEKCGGFAKYRGIIPDQAKMHEAFDNSLLIEKIENGEIQV